jgi:Photosynthesis system II assembly factor YCF48
MPNVPNIVRERLKAATSAVDHPDADVLAAFSERSLPELERERVLEHVARCADCREILALALPPHEEAQLVVKPSPDRLSGRWLSWPSLRWGFVTAGILLIGSLGVVEYQRHQTHAPTAASNSAVHESAPQNEVAANQPQPSPVPPAATPQATSAEQPSQPHSNGRMTVGSAPATNRIATEFKDQREKDQPEADLKMGPKSISPVHVPQRSTSPGGGIGGGVMRSGPDAVLNQQQLQVPSNGRAFPQVMPSPSAKQQADSEITRAASAPASSETVETQSENMLISLDQPRDLPVQKGSVPDRASVNYSESGVGKAKLPVTPQPASAAAAPAPNALNPLPLQTQPGLLRAYAAPLPRWSISSTGGLQRSYDGGKTWQDVNVNSTPAPTADSVSFALASSASADSITEKDVNAKKAKRESAPEERSKAAPIVFRAVSAVGADVWAGGSSGALYHSLDAGAHWSRVTPVSSNAPLAGDIVSLQFSDVQHGALTTAAPEVWITSDGGQTWQKQ